MICLTTAMSNSLILRPRYLATISMYDTIENPGPERKKKMWTFQKKLMTRFVMEMTAPIY